MNGLALYSGIAGIELGLKFVVPEYRTVCYVEREAYPAAVTVTRMAEKVLDEAPRRETGIKRKQSAPLC